MEEEEKSGSTQYLRFSAYSLRQLILQKLAADTKFTDQVYLGSNLSLLIDVVSYMYQCLLYNLNNAASEAMWSDAQVYSNISRLAKLVGYCPAGATAAACEFTAAKDTFTEDVAIPRYACLQTGKTDSRGRSIAYSTVAEQSPKDQLDENDLPRVLAYNGVWKLHSTVFHSSGEPWMEFELEGVTSDSSAGTYVSDKWIDVYVQDPTTGDVVRWLKRDGLFSSSATDDENQIYSGQDMVYVAKLDENKQYRISFGNGKHGAIPAMNSAIYVFYLDSNGPEGSIELGEVADAKLVHSAASLGCDDELYSRIFPQMSSGAEAAATSRVLDSAKWSNMSNSTTASSEETVESIRRSAPQNKKIGGRLVTASDWKWFTLNRFRDYVADCECQNNWGYASTFYRWLYNLGEQNHSSGTYYLRQSKLAKLGYKWADAADTNNVYLWLKTRGSSELYLQQMEKAYAEVKTIVQEPVFLEALDVAFMPCAQDAAQVKKLVASGDYSFAGNYLEIAVSNDYNVSAADVASRVAGAIADFFSESRMSLGCAVDTSKLRDEIIALPDVARVRTVYVDPDTGAEQIVSGVSLASWTVSLVDRGDDLTVQAAPTQLEVFQFPKLYTSSLQPWIRVIGKSSNASFQTQY